MTLGDAFSPIDLAVLVTVSARSRLRAAGVGA